MALNIDHALPKLIFIRYWKEKSNKQALNARFPTPSDMGFRIPNYDPTVEQPAFTRADLPHIQFFFEKNMPKHPVVGGAELQSPEETGAK